MESTTVHFDSLTESEIEAYIATGSHDGAWQAVCKQGAGVVLSRYRGAFWEGRRLWHPGPCRMLG